MCRPRAQFPAADPALPLDTDPDVSALGTMREALIAAVASESAQYRRSAARSSSWTVEKICAACQASDEAIDVALVLVNHALSGVLRRDTFLLDGLFVALEKLDVVLICGRVRPTGVRPRHQGGPGGAAGCRWRTRWDPDRGAWALVRPCGGRGGGRGGHVGGHEQCLQHH